MRTIPFTTLMHLRLSSVRTILCIALHSCIFAVIIIQKLLQYLGKQLLDRRISIDVLYIIAWCYLARGISTSGAFIILVSARYRIARNFRWA